MPEYEMRRDQLEALLPLVSPRIGVVRSLDRRAVSDDAPRPVILYDAVISNYDFLTPRTGGRGSCGKGFTDEEAMLGALGEALEHYCGSHPPAARMRRAAAAKLEGPACLPGECALYSEHQYNSPDFPFPRCEASTEIPWIKGTELGAGRAAWVPAGLVYLNYSGEQTQDFLCPPTSNGLAAGATLTGAIRHALLELIEREAFMITWLNRLVPVEWNAGNLPPALAEIIGAFAKAGTRIRLYVLPTDMPAFPVLALALSEAPGPAAVIGLGCGMDLESGVRGALFEICQMFEPLRRKCSKGFAASLKSYSDVRTLEQHAGYYCRHDHLHEFDFLQGEPQREWKFDVTSHATGSDKEDCDRLVEAIQASGCSAFYVDVTTPDLKDFPVRVVRAIVTQMQPIHFGCGQERLGGSRLYELPVRLGLATERPGEEKMNRAPHPLA